MDCGSLVIDLQHEALLAFAVDLLVYDLDVLKVAGEPYFLVID